MLRYFRINDPYRLLGVLIVGLLLSLPVLIETPSITYPELKSIVIGEKVHEGNVPFAELVDNTPPLTSWFYGLVDVVFGRNLVARHITAFLLIFLQGVYLAIVCINRKVFADSSYLPPLLYVTLAAFSYDTLALTGELIGAGFLLMAINNLYKELEFRAQRDDTVVGLGLFVSFASLCSFAYSIFFIASFLILVFYSRRDLRTLLLLSTGFALPHMLMICIYFLMGHISALIDFYYTPNLSFQSHHYISLKSLLVLTTIPFTFFLISLFVLSREGRLTKYQSQVLQSMFFWFLFSIISLSFAKDLRPQSFIVVIPSLSYFLTHFFLSFQRKIIAELCLWILLIGTGLVNFFAKNSAIDAVNYDDLVVNKQKQTNKSVTGKRMLVLSDDIDYYINNELATPFMNWDLSKEIFTNPDYYENVVWVYESFTNDPPDYIIDPGGHLKLFFERIPTLEKKYHSDRDGNYFLK